MRYEETTITRDVELIQIPDGTRVTIPGGTEAVITQSLGDTYTLQLPTMGGLYRLAGKDADAIGKPLPLSAEDSAAAESGPLDEKPLWDALRLVYDPEIPVNVVELGLIYDLQIERTEDGRNRVVVKMTLTAPGCGMGPVIASDAKDRLEAVPGVSEADVEVVFDPPWNQAMMSEAAKLELGMY
ncbi:MAG TPA: putative Fe-S cluster assembly protein SufT [Terriglobales bacterium]|nr:putative Fe-S cluster assembly protein SufT [Terriglobales bacterium]